MSEARKAAERIDHVVMFSGGIGSWAAAKRVVERHGTEGVVLLFADTLMEDEDTYRFLDEAAANVGARMVTIMDGRTPWEVFFDEGMMGNNRADLCSRILKRQLLDKWRVENCDPETATNYVGIDWTEKHRIERLRKVMTPWRFEAPMCDAPLMTKQQMHEWAEREGLNMQRLYRMGMPHANCGGFCIKAGIAHFTRLLQVMPERYRFHEEQEQAFRKQAGKDVSILRDRRGGTRKPLTLKALRERIESDGQQCLTFDESLEWGGCGCAIE